MMAAALLASGRGGGALAPLCEYRFSYRSDTITAIRKLDDLARPHCGPPQICERPRVTGR